MMTLSPWWWLVGYGNTEVSSCGCLWSWGERLCPAGSDHSCLSILMLCITGGGEQALLFLGVTQQPLTQLPCCTSSSSALHHNDPRASGLHPQKLEHSKDGNKFPTIPQVDIPMQRIYVCYTTNPFFFFFVIEN